MRKYQQRQEEIFKTFLVKLLKIWSTQVIRKNKRLKSRRRKHKVQHKRM